MAIIEGDIGQNISTGGVSVVTGKDYRDMSTAQQIGANLLGGGQAFLFGNESRKRSPEEITYQAGLEALAKQREGAEKAIGFQTETYNRLKALYEPYAELGRKGLGMLTQTQGPDALYNAQRQEFLDSLTMMQKARGRLESSDTIKKATKGLTDLSQQAYNRQFGKAIDLAQLGQGAVTAMGGAGNATSNNVGGILNAAGTAMNQTMGATGQNIASLYSMQGQQTANLYNSVAGSVAGLGSLAATYYR